MAPGIKAEPGDSEDANPACEGADTSAAEAALKARLARKRTKTGCLTCRKRRIKCGEERPICKNCIKSKRHCEGYNPRVTFKPPTFEFRPVPHGGAQITFQAGPTPGPNIPLQAQNAPPQMSPAYYQPIQAAQPPQHVPTLQQPAPQFVQVGPGLYQPMPPDTYNVQLPQHQQASCAPVVSYPYAPGPFPIGSASQVYHGITTPITPQQPQWMPPRTDSVDYYDVAAATQNDVKFEPDDRTVSSSTNNFYTNISPVTPAYNHREAWTMPTYVPRPELVRPIDSQLTGYDAGAFPENLRSSISHQYVNSPSPEYYEQTGQLPQRAGTTQYLSEAAVEFQDDDYWDVESNEEADSDTLITLASSNERRQAFNRIQTMHQTSSQELQLQRFSASLFNGVLDHYRVEQTANPLRNPVTARVFAHFISVTGPGLSMFERRLPESSMGLGYGRIPLSQQGLWTYSMPMMALHNQGLLHAMLALSSLHIARLQGASTTPSMQHYAWALKRIHHSVGHQKKRLQLPTIAASMLLGFYEVMSAEHNKWSSHLAGAKQLFIEIDFVGLEMQVRKMKAERSSRMDLGRRQRKGSESPEGRNAMLDQILDVDERLVSHLTGHEVRYGQHGSVDSRHASIPPGMDLTKYEILRDLYWWYCKQDCFQSLVSGNPPLMSYSRWANCPPRAPMGKVDAIHGTFDHLVLLLGRITNFAAKDRSRKLKQIEANGGQWRPAPWMKMPSQPPNAQGPARTPPAPPAFFGMAPSQPTNTPSMYTASKEFDSPQSARSYDPIDLDTAMKAAMEEYGRIRSALHTFSSNLGEAFEPLTSDYQPSMQTPFGPALFYRSFDIASIWSFYNLAVLVAIRSHPHMPPAAHMAAGVAAHETSFFANEIGRIAAGIMPPPPDQPLSPILAAALNDTCMPSFFAAIQYQKADQRRATVERIFALSQRTGWGSGEVIANGCETAWVKAADAGRGPPYQRTTRKRSADDPRLNGSWERLDWNKPPREGDESDRRYIRSKAESRVLWAVGILGMEEDMAAMAVDTE